jgi:hypothetical protein
MILPALPFSRFAIVHHESQMRTIAAAIFANPDFASSHVHIVAILLPQKQVKSRENAFLYVRMSMMAKRA